MPKGPQVLDRSLVLENHERFLMGAVVNQEAFTVFGKKGPVSFPSNSEGEPRDVYVFWSERSWAEQALAQSLSGQGFSVRDVPLFELLYRWLPGLSRKGHAVGTNWSQDLVGIELEAKDLSEQLHQSMSEPMRAAYQQALDDAKKQRS